MREQKDRCIFFVLENFFFLIPLPFVDKVIENSLPEEREPETEFIDLWAESGKNSKNKYCILINCKEEKLGVPAAEILGFRDISEGQVWELMDPVRVKKNRYLCAAHETQLEDGRKVLAYLLDVCLLYTSFTSDIPACFLYILTTHLCYNKLENPSSDICDIIQILNDPHAR